ncbi:MAG: pirin family protein [Hyphomonadaceae bacterium]|nr:pirin family protein [Hyphomonadaceae bacterium]
MTAPIEQIIKPREKDLGDGFVVRRILPFHNRKMVGPFIFFDHFGPVDYAPGTGFDVRPHPHIGLATVTFLFEGAMRHKDNLGNDLVIRPGAVNWMTAGRGICHSERTPDAERAAGQSMHGIQTWVALPKTHAEIAPDFVHHPAETLPAFDLGGARARVLAGTAFGHSSPVTFPWGIWYVGAEADEEATFAIGGGEADERAVYIASGSATIGGDTITVGQMAILTPGADADVTVSAGTRFMLAGGETMDGPRKIDWNFVAADKDRIEQAKADWRASAAGNWTDTPFTLPDGEQEYIPLPEDETVS